LRRANNNVQLASFLKHKLWRISNTRTARVRAKPPDTPQVTDCTKNPRFGARWHASCLYGYLIPLTDNEEL
jgi:hypothetical protein